MTKWRSLQECNNGLILRSLLMPFLTLEDLRMKNPNFISTDTEKAADKIQPPILDKRGE